MPSVSNTDRLSGLDASFLHLESGPTHMHVGSCLVFEGEAPNYNELATHIEKRLSLVPRYRQKLAFVPFQQGRPVWVDDPHFNLRYHVRHTALPEPGTDEELKYKASWIFSQTLDRSKPLWEIWLIEGLENNRFALIGKTHHCLVDGISGIDIVSVLFDTTPEPMELAEETSWIPRPLPSDAELLAQALAERASAPREIARGVKSVFRRPRQALETVREQAIGLGAVAWAGLDPAPASPLNVKIGSHRRFEWVTADLQQFKQIKNRLGGTVNDVVLAVVTGALRRFLAGRGNEIDGLQMKAMVPVSVRSQDEEGALGNKVTVMTATLPIGEKNEIERLNFVAESMAHIKEGGQAVGAKALTELTGFAPPTIASQASRLQARQRFFNLLVTNIPGPQFPIYLLGREMLGIYPQVPLSQNQALAVAVMSYNGAMNFGLIGDYDEMSDLAVLAEDFKAAIGELAAAAELSVSKEMAPASADAKWIPSGKKRKRPAARKKAAQQA